MNSATARIAVVGLGYVGLPLAVAFGRRYPTIGFDIDETRTRELRDGYDRTGEIDGGSLSSASQLSISSNVSAIEKCNVYIITVPTPIDEANQPDLNPLRRASEMVARLLGKDDVVIYESTVYPGTTEEVCVPVLEAGSGLVYNRDFYCGYSPERINPGDKIRKLESIVKVTSGSTEEVAQFVDDLYGSIIAAGTFQASSIRVAEAAKVIENTQRDVNIALVNELAMIFNKMKINTSEVLSAASTKWNFLPFRPGLVGGHCIGVDPYYLTHKASVLGYHPELMLAARRINSRMGLYVAHRVMALMARSRINVVDAKILVLGLTFKEDCHDLRNTRVLDVVAELEAANARVDVFDPWVLRAEGSPDVPVNLVGTLEDHAYDAIVLAVAHTEFRQWDRRRFEALIKPGGIFYDIKNALPEGLAHEGL